MPSRDYPAVHRSPPDNAELAARLDQFASLLELAGAGPYTARAYRRAADLIRSTPAPVAELVRQGRARELRGIGPGIERRLQELVTTGRLAELGELERQGEPALVAPARLIGLSSSRLVALRQGVGGPAPRRLRDPGGA